MVQGLNPSTGNIFLTCLDQPSGLPSLLYNGFQVIPRSYGGQGVALTTHPPLEPRLKKEYSYASTPLRALMAGYRLEFKHVLKMHILLGFLME
jgi:hypothetical protein